MPPSPNSKGDTVKIQEIDLDEIEDIDAQPDEDFIAGIRQRGQLAPVILEQTRKGTKYRVTAGRRRIAALRVLAARWAALSPDEQAQARTDRYPQPYVLAHVRHKIGTVERTLDLLVENLQRSRNYAAEADAVATLLEAGFTERRITDETGIPIAKVSQLAKMKRSLVPGAFDKLRRNEITKSAALGLMRLPEDQQATLAQEDALPVATVAAAVRAYNQDALAALDQIETPAAYGFMDLAAQLDAATGRFAGEQRHALAIAAEILRSYRPQAEAAGG